MSEAVSDSGRIANLTVVPEAHPVSDSPNTDIDAVENYINRELSLLRFNWRVLQLALDESIPLLERIRFIFICSNNLDEFFEVRVANLRHMITRGEALNDPDGLQPTDLLQRIHEATHTLVDEQYRILNETIMPRLEQENISFLGPHDWNKKTRAWLKRYFRQQVVPVISPISLDLTHPFPRLINKSLHFLLKLKGNDAFGRNLEYAVLHMPRSLPRVIELPDAETDREGQQFVFLSAIITEFAEELFPGMEIMGCYQFRLTRDSDLLVDEHVVEDLAVALKRELQARNFGASVRLEIGKNCPNKIANFLLQKCGLDEDALFRVDGAVNLNRMMPLSDMVNRPDLKYRGFNPKVPDVFSSCSSVFDAIEQEDILLHHPYESFQPVIELVKQAAADPDVLAIKQTLYRTGSDSRMIEALIDAAHAGKEVTAVIELRARFDEASNIALAQKLQEAGALVVYGVVGYKTHAKMMLIVRREKKRLKRFVHLGTGNYHAGNAKLYTDYSFMTDDREIGEDVHRVFQQLTGMGKVYKLNKLWTAPFTLQKNLLKAIDREIALAETGEKARIVIKINSLTESELIKALYRASQAGVKVDLIVRGICCLKPGIKGLSDNITVRSVIGRFLEHSRVYYFRHGGEENIYLASADLMDRNLHKRVEVCFPVEHPQLKKRLVQELVSEFLGDNGQSWMLQSNCRYEKRTTRGAERKVQDRLLEKLSN